MTKQKKFNVTGICIPKLHYMVDTTDIIDEIIRSYITCDAYFTINRARQYGKSTTLELLYHRLEKDYLVLDISFEAAEDCFSSQSPLANDMRFLAYRLFPFAVFLNILFIVSKYMSPGNIETEKE